jgi:dihydrofolate reductase
MSLDGYIAGPNGEFDWIPMDPDIDFNALFAPYDAVLMGRKSYIETRSMTGGMMKGKNVYVFSHTLTPADCPGVFLANNPAEVVAGLKAKPGGDLWLFGGGQLFRSMLEAGLVDEIDVAVIPILLGKGLPFLPETSTRSKLRLTGHRHYPTTGTIFLQYAVS